MSNHKSTVRMEIGGKLHSQGELQGTGTLSISISDASRAGLTLDYTTEDKVTVTIASAVGFSISSMGVTLSSGVNYATLDEKWSTQSSITLDISKSVAMTLQQNFAATGPSTSLSISITI